MSRVGDLHECFVQHVRVFSMIITLRTITVRVHRAALDKGHLSYFYSEVISYKSFTKDEAYQIYKNILEIYGVGELLGILKVAFQQVSAKEQLRIQELGTTGSGVCRDHGHTG